MYVKTLHYGINRILLLSIGLWPHEQSRITQLQFILINGTLISSIIFQLTTFLTSKSDALLIIEVFACAISFFICIIKYSSYALNINALKQLTRLLDKAYSDVKDKGEAVIMGEYENYGKCYTLVFTILGVGGSIIIAFSSYFPYFWDIVIPNNVSLSHELLRVRAEYFVNQQKYFHYIVLYTNATICLELMIMIAVGAMNMVYVQLICGLFKIASYRVEQSMLISTPKMSGKKKYLVHQGIISAINVHREAVRLVNFYLSKMEIFFLYIIVMGVTSSSLNLYRVFQILSSEFNFEKLITPVTFLNIFFIYVITANNCAQQLMDHNDYIFFTAYNVQWYNAPINIQKMMLFMLQRGTKPFHLMLGGMFVGSLESAAKLMSTSMSYFTVLYSTRQA